MLVCMDIFRQKNTLNILKKIFAQRLSLLDEIREPTQEAFKSNFGDD
jgi:hypothetical protein